MEPARFHFAVDTTDAVAMGAFLMALGVKVRRAVQADFA